MKKPKVETPDFAREIRNKPKNRRALLNEVARCADGHLCPDRDTCERHLQRHVGNSQTVYAKFFELRKPGRAWAMRHFEIITKATRTRCGEGPVIASRYA